MNVDRDPTGKKAEFTRRYHAAAHGCQSATAFLMQSLGASSAGADQKHLRVGLSMTLVDSAAMAQLLMRKGVITEIEYLEAIAVGAEQELERLTSEVHAKTGMTHLRFG